MEVKSVEKYRKRGDYMPDKMTINEFVTECIKYNLEFDVNYYELTPYDEYCIHIILGNQEHIIPVWDEYRLAQLWYKDILEYHIY